MSAVGFAPEESDNSEVGKLRKMCEDLNSLLRNIKDAQGQLDALNIGMAKAHLDVALHYAREAKNTVSELGKTHNSKSKVNR